MKQSILILGVNGFIGQGLLRFFRDSNFETIGISKKGNAYPQEFVPNIAYQFKLPSNELANVIRKHKPDFILNATGKSNVSFSFTNPEEDFLENTNVTIQILNLIREFSKKSKFIYLSSASVYGNPKSLPITEDSEIKPISAYGYHKFIGELICEEYSQLFGVSTASMRIFSAYGKGLRKQVIYDFCQKLFIQSSVSMFGTGDESRDFIHIDDVARAIGIVMDKGQMQGERYNLGSGEEITVRDLSNKIRNFSNIDKKIIFTNEIHEGSPRNWRADITKLKSLGFSTSISIDAGLDEYVKWYRETFPR
jgi:UDP-glucose 4-epimerase